MNYAYDVLINMNEDRVFNFYEWENFDPIELVKKIPLYRVNSKIIKDFYLYNIKVTQDFLNDILDKTILKNNKINKTIKYACLLCDSKNSLVIEFNDDGSIFSRSSLLLEDEANIIEFIYSYKESNLVYEKGDLSNLKYNLRQEENIKRVIELEINTLIENKNDTKLKYLYNEWFGYEESSVDKIKDNMLNELNNNISIQVKKIYELIILSYNNN